MKLLRACWYTVMAASFFAGRLTGRREFFLLLFIMCFVLIYSLLLNLWTAWSFRYLQELDKKVCVSGSKALMRVSIVNDKPFPFALIRLTMVPVARSRTAFEQFSLLPGSRIDFSVPMLCPYRGIHGVGISTLQISDGFGLFSTTFNMHRLSYYRPMEIKVYPRLHELTYLPGGENDSKRMHTPGYWQSEHGESYASLRKYAPGDPFKRIHRAVSSRRREWFVRTYEAPVETSLVILLDTAAACGTEEELLYLGDLACECAAAIARCGLKAGHRVIYSDAGLPSVYELNVLGDFQKLYDRLAVVKFEPYAGGAADFLAQVDLKLLAERPVYLISARGGADVREVLSRTDTSALELNIVEAHLNTASKQGSPDSTYGLPGVRVIRVVSGDDIAAVLS